MSLSNLRRYVNAYENYRKELATARSAPPSAVNTAATMRYSQLLVQMRRKPHPLSKHNTQRLEQAKQRWAAASAAVVSNRKVIERYRRVKEEVAAAFGRTPNRFMTANSAQKILNMAENAAARSVAGAVNRSALANRAAYKRRIRNMIAAELRFYANNNNSSIRPSNIARSIRR